MYRKKEINQTFKKVEERLNKNKFFGYFFKVGRKRLSTSGKKQAIKT